MKFLCIISTFFIMSSALAVKFTPEKGVYNLTSSDVIGEIIQKSYISLSPNYLVNDVSYKLLSDSNEYQIKDWHKQDWYKLQGMFKLDESAYISSFNTETFNEAKRIQYRDFSFNKKKFIYKKLDSAPREWGGLTHPPVRGLSLPLRRYNSNYQHIQYDNIESPYFDPNLQRDIDNASKSELSFGNKITPLMDNKSFEQKKELIKNAKHSIFISSLVFVCDESSKQIRDLLILKKREGLDVRVILDNTITNLTLTGKCPDSLEKAGVEVLRLKGIFKLFKHSIYHSKVLVTDLHTTITGGQNLIDADNESRGTDFKNRDMDIKIKGPMVLDIAKSFLEAWELHKRKKHTSMTQYLKKVNSLIGIQRQEGIRGSEFYDEVLQNKKTRMNGVCRFINQTPYKNRYAIGNAYLKLLKHVNKYLLIADPIKEDTYKKSSNFKMFNKLHTATQDLAKAGINIDYLTTNISMAGNENVAIMNKLIKKQLSDGQNFWANVSLLRLNMSNNYYGKKHYKNLMKDWLPYDNVNIFKHISFMHSKIFYFDRIVSSIGSYNFQHNATDLSYESTTICMDEKLNNEIDEILVLDMANSLPMVNQ